VHLSLAPRTVCLVRWIQWTLTGMILCASGLSGWWWWESRSLADEAARYAAAAMRTEELNRQFAAAMRAEQLTLTPQQIAGIKQEVAFINQLADKRSFSWTQLLSDLEEALPPGTSIGKIQLDMKESLVTFDGLAARMQDLNALMASLQSHRSFSRPVLHHHKIMEADKVQGRQAGEDNPERAPAGVEYALTVHYRRSL
jgi:Tfp pilus assembly protein PilN